MRKRRFVLKDKKNVSFRPEGKKGHNPNYTKDAVLKLAEYTSALGKFSKKKTSTAIEQAAFRSSFDRKGMTEQDEQVWQEIFEVLKA